MTELNSEGPVRLFLLTVSIIGHHQFGCSNGGFHPAGGGGLATLARWLSDALFDTVTVAQR